MTHALDIGLGWVARFLPRVLGPEWSIQPAMDGARYINRRDALVVIISGAFELDGKRWLHFSCSHQGRVPSWDELHAMKNLFIGKEKLAVQVLPPESRYINIYPHVLHLWHCVDADPVPDFARGVMRVSLIEKAMAAATDADALKALVPVIKALPAPEPQNRLRELYNIRKAELTGGAK